MSQFLHTITQIIYSSDDTNKFKIDDTPDGKQNERFFRDELYRILRESQSAKLKHWLWDYEKDFATQSGNCSLQYLLDSIQEHINQDHAWKLQKQQREKDVTDLMPEEVRKQLANAGVGGGNKNWKKWQYVYDGRQYFENSWPAMPAEVKPEEKGGKGGKGQGKGKENKGKGKEKKGGKGKEKGGKDGPKGKKGYGKGKRKGGKDGPKGKKGDGKDPGKKGR